MVGSLCFVILLSVGALDYFVSGFHFFALYAFFIALASLLLGGKLGLTAAVLSAVMSTFLRGDTWNYWFSIPQLLNGIFDLTLFLMIVWVINRLRRALNHESRAAREDYLTGALNKRSFTEILDKEIHRCRRYGRTFCLCYVDLDDFKKVNDALGHAAGDEILQLTVRVLEDCTRIVDSLGRLGGDEFAVLLPESDLTAGVKVVERIRDCFQQRFRDRDFTTGLSLGLVAFSQIPDGSDQAFAAADRMMYQAKKKGKNNFQFLVWENNLGDES